MARDMQENGNHMLLENIAIPLYVLFINKLLIERIEIKR